MTFILIVQALVFSLESLHDEYDDIIPRANNTRQSFKIVAVKRMCNRQWWCMAPIIECKQLKTCSLLKKLDKMYGKNKCFHAEDNGFIISTYSIIPNTKTSYA